MDKVYLWYDLEEEEYFYSNKKLPSINVAFVKSYETVTDLMDDIIKLNKELDIMSDEFIEE